MGALDSLGVERAASLAARGKLVDVQLEPCAIREHQQVPGIDLVAKLIEPHGAGEDIDDEARVPNTTELNLDPT